MHNSPDPKRYPYFAVKDWKSGIKPSWSGLKFNDLCGKLWKNITGLSLGFEKFGSGLLFFLKAAKGKACRGGCIAIGKRVLNPEAPFLRRWNAIWFVSCVVALLLDPLFLYIPVIDINNKCIGLDTKLQKTATALRSVIDIFYIVRITFQFRASYLAPSSRIFGGSEVCENPSKGAWRYLSSYFLVDILAILPLPQVVVSVILPKMRGSRAYNSIWVLKFLIPFQFVPRFVRVHQLYKEIKRNSLPLKRTTRIKAATTLFLYIAACHVIGACWYFFSLEREMICWRMACRSHPGCEVGRLYCDRSSAKESFLNDYEFLDRDCPVGSQDGSPFNFGIYFDAVNSGILESRSFLQKFLFCSWWALQNISTLGQTLKTSTYIWELCFALGIFLCGLVLFSSVIGVIQTIMLSSTIRLDEMETKQQDVEHWMSDNLLPGELRKLIRRHEEYNWQKNKGLDVENLLNSLPKYLRRDIKRYLCLSLLNRVPLFECMDEQLLDEMCDCLKPVYYTENSYIFRKGDPVDDLLFVKRGRLSSVTTDGGREGFFCSSLKAGDFCGDELLSWALDPRSSSSNLPMSTRTVRTLTEVEAFALMADDLKKVASKFSRLQSERVRHIFRFYSQQWRTWAACFIQAAWRRYYKKKTEHQFQHVENRLQDALSSGTNRKSPSTGAAIYASQFAVNALRVIRRSSSRKERHGGMELPSIPRQRPAEADFTAE